MTNMQQEPTKGQLKEWAQAPNLDASPTRVPETGPLLDKDEFNASDARPVYGNPFLKLGVVGVVISPIFLIVWAFIGGNLARVPQLKNGSAAAPNQSHTNTPTEVEVLRQKLGDANARLAMLSQKQSQPSPAVKTKASSSTPTTTAPSRPIVSPAPQPVVRVIAPSPSVITRPIQETGLLPQRLNSPTPSIQKAPEDPEKAWLEASNEGSFSGISSGNKRTDDSQPTTVNASTSPPSVGIGTPLAQVTQNAQIVQPPPTVYQPTILSTDPSKQIILGTYAEGRVDTTIRWSTSGLQSLTQQTIVIKLTKSLKAADGRSEPIPQGSYLIAQITNVDSSGYLQLLVRAVYLNINGQIQLNPTSLPTGAIEIFDKQGNPLQAKLHAPKTGRSFLSVLSNAAGIAGLATNNSSFSALNTLQGIRQNSQSQTSYFSLEQGTTVRPYIKQSFSL